jgi:hypothetical protein
MRCRALRLYLTSFVMTGAGLGLRAGTLAVRPRTGYCRVSKPVFIASGFSELN